MRFYCLSFSIFFPILVTFPLARSHPQCLDFRPPFESKNITFCTQYKDFGCCTKQQDQSIFRKFESIKSYLSDRMLSNCEPYLHELLCQTCSPYAAHIYSAEQTMQVSTFPGLCNNYCLEFYSKCRDLIQYITNDRFILGSLDSKETFCLLIQLTDPDYCYPDLIKNHNLNFKISIPQVTKEGCLCVEYFAWDLRSPLLARHAGDGSGRLFIAEQRGVVYIYYRNRTREKRAFLDIKHKVLYSQYIADERGFLGLAFHPQFITNRKFYVYYSARLPKHRECIRISEFKVYNRNRNRANRKSEKTILQVEQPYSNHNGGEILFGDDGYLYIFIGDGGSGGDPLGNSQNKSVLLGKALRIDVDKRSPGNRYGIPLDNPFVNETGTRPEIYAYGIRNIWRCDKDEGDRKTGENKGRIICGEVGQNAYEEIDILYKGANYGWNGREGYQCFNPSVCGLVGPEELPIFSYPHSIGKSITGGHVYRGCESPNLNGQYIYGDFTNGRLFRMYQNKTTQLWTNKEVFMCGTDVCFNGLIGQYEPYILSFGKDEYGEIYILTTNLPSATIRAGTVYKLVDPVRRGDPEACQSGVKFDRYEALFNTTGEWLDSASDGEYLEEFNDYGSAECLDPSGYLCTPKELKMISIDDDEYDDGSSDILIANQGFSGSGSTEVSGDGYTTLKIKSIDDEDDDEDGSSDVLFNNQGLSGSGSIEVSSDGYTAPTPIQTSDEDIYVEKESEGISFSTNVFSTASTSDNPSVTLAPVSTTGSITTHGAHPDKAGSSSRSGDHPDKAGSSSSSVNHPDKETSRSSSGDHPNKAVSSSISDDHPVKETSHSSSGDRPNKAGSSSSSGDHPDREDSSSTSGDHPDSVDSGSSSGDYKDTSSDPDSLSGGGYPDVSEALSKTPHSKSLRTGTSTIMLQDKHSDNDFYIENDSYTKPGRKHLSGSATSKKTRTNNKDETGHSSNVGYLSDSPSDSQQKIIRVRFQPLAPGKHPFQPVVPGKRSLKSVSEIFTLNGFDGVTQDISESDYYDNQKFQSFPSENYQDTSSDDCSENGCSLSDSLPSSVRQQPVSYSIKNKKYLFR